MDKKQIVSHLGVVLHISEGRDVQGEVPGLAKIPEKVTFGRAASKMGSAMGPPALQPDPHRWVPVCGGHDRADPMRPEQQDSNSVGDRHQERFAEYSLCRRTFKKLCSSGEKKSLKKTL